MRGWIDLYALRARLLPALLAIFPLLVAGTLVTPASLASSGRTVVSLAISCGILVVFAQIARFLGLRKERELVREWGGFSTTRWLRHRDTALDHMTKERYHAFLGGHVPGLVLPNASAERLDPAAADECYRSAASWLREHTRDKAKHSLVFEENANYGFARNTLALKPWALVVASAVMLGVIAKGYIEYRDGVSEVTPEYMLTFAVSLIWLLGWGILVSTAWVTRASDTYAKALLAACDALSAPPAAKAR